MDDSELIGYERTAAYSTDYTFTTLTASEISGIEISDKTLSSVVLSWKTISIVSSIIEYGETQEYGETVTLSSTGGETTHTTRISDLAHSTTYHFRVRGTTSDGDEIVSQDSTFSTTTFPKVTAVVFTTDQSQGGTMVSLAYSTNVMTTGEVQYQAVDVDPEYAKTERGKTLFVETDEGMKVDVGSLRNFTQSELLAIPVVPKGEAKNVYDGVYALKRVQKVSDLEDGLMYIFTIRGRDEYGNEFASTPIRYVTGADTRPPTIQNLVIETPVSGTGIETKVQAIISFETDEPAQTKILWGQGTGSEYPNSTETQLGFGTKHVIVLRDLDPTTSYHLKIIAQDESRNVSESVDTVVVTPTAQQAALDIILKNLDEVFGFLKLL
ncbi:MAG: hypothetical protein A2378_01120 [Candidatus Pacebacteria bacterium RIFOXYB1_FULL_44_10]|nr:MAG: hypothetical protein A2378_01120 [Candidatus Pacebacteria bacterium RIFOXYB1_FULL_44_10]